MLKTLRLGCSLERVVGFEVPPEGFAENALLKPRGLLTLLKGVDGASSSQELADLNSLLEDPIVMLPASDVRRRLPELSASG